ncbi:MAG TPA: hypothetical protein VKB41_03945 [Steroidobacteraceae bacterium]|nr:hypothetical protein [Steroidobacteraceae bacterium]
MNTLVCWKCGASLAALTLPLRRLEECKACGAELHVCRMCVDYDTAVAKSCREPIAEEVQDKERANFCDYFQPRPDAYKPRDETEAQKSRAALDTLFGGQAGGTPASADSSRARLEELFKKK